LFGDRLDLDIDNMFYDVCDNIVLSHTKADFEGFEMDLLRMIGIDSPVNSEEYAKIDNLMLTEKVYQSLRANYDRKNDKIAQRTFPQIKHVFETMSNKYTNIVFELTDGIRNVQIVLDLEKAYKSNGTAIAKSVETNIILGMIDNEWKEHLREMDDLRSAVNNAQYEQKDPLLVYKLESFELFKAMLGRLNNEAVELLARLDIPNEQEVQSTNKAVTHQNNYEKAQISNSTSSTTPPRFQGSEGYDEAMRNSMPEVEKRQPVIAEPKAGRNEPCPCGSGKKFKQCHGK
jgi:preprotein translocase subunit SecA